ncbi:TPA: hypothetical protein DIV48_01135 [Candidatus Kaiserbacteria bacterium]|nr:MAG: hypothetical protein UY93_C0002G0020 [Parcubacteria group bacterium GW2011_GWA1_56_13]KKW46308.1 MAG: hypothetical protein UY97_C0007G0019 [Parcubacteria group bacterium GW2011_GWB1_57_6]HCR52235.1 hypothetical protein [Candidatus Kaiserbacteria bacterium]
MTTKVKFSRHIDYFLKLRTLLGSQATVAFALAHLRNKLRPPKKGLLARVPVGPHVFYFPSLDSFVGLFTEIFFKETYFIGPTDAPIEVIDCGANIGVSLLYIKLRAPCAHVQCFEPNPAARTVLEKNIQANGWEKDVRVFPYALGASRGTANLFVDDTEETSSSGSIANHAGKKNRPQHSYQIEVDTLSRYIVSTVHLLKLDIEGPEFDVLEELRTGKKLSQVETIQLEYHYIPGSFTRPLSEMLALLESAGFRTFVKSTSQPHQIINRDVAHAYMIFAWR